MKKKVLLSILLFCAGFIVTYLLLCYLPSLRIKLAAEPMEYFIESIKHNAFNKGMLSFAGGTVLAIIPYAIRKKQKHFE